MDDAAFLRCIRPSCAATYDLAEPRYACAACGNLLDVAYDWDKLSVPGSLVFFAERWRSRNERLDLSGVWRFRELLPVAPPADLVTIGEGQTLLQTPDVTALDLPLAPGHLHLQYEGMNPSGSFKDNGMAAAFTMARRLGRPRVACASTGNTSASLALFAALTRMPGGEPMRGIVFIGSGTIALGKLSQALDHGALTVQIQGDFDACLKHIREAADRLNLYLMNSVNPFRLEGQKAIMYRVLEGLGWEPPDWIICPGGNLGNASAFGKALKELHDLELIPRLPRLAVINAAGADTLYQLHTEQGLRWNGGDWNETSVFEHYAALDAAGHKARTVATAIQIARPVNLPKALRSLEIMDGVVHAVSDEQILEEKARVGRAGFGCEPASAASLAGLRDLLARDVIDRDAQVVCVLTGHALKDPDATVSYHTGRGKAAPAPEAGPTSRFANRPISVADDFDAICRLIETHA